MPKTLPNALSRNGHCELIAAANKKGFDYSALPASRRRVIDDETRILHQVLRRTALGVVEIGQRLELVSTVLDCHQYQAWLKAEFDWSIPMATRFRQAARAFGEVDCVAQFEPSAMYELAAGGVPREAFDEALERARQGECITKKIAAEIVHRRRRALGESPRRRPRNGAPERLVEGIEAKFEEALEFPDAGRELLARQIETWAETWPALLREGVGSVSLVGAEQETGDGGPKCERQAARSFLCSKRR